MKDLFSSAVTAYMEHRTSRGLALMTRRNDMQVLTRALTIIGNIYVENIHEEHIDKYFRKASLTRSPASLNVDHTTLQSFFKWAVRTKRMGRFDDPMTDRPRPKFARREWRGVGMHKFPALLDSAPNARDRMYLAMGLYSLGRSAELNSICIEQLDLDRGFIYYPVPKSHKVDDMPICLELDREIRHWLKIYQEECGPLQPNWFLVPARTSPQVDARGVIIPGSSRLKPDRKIAVPSRIVRPALIAVGYPVEDADGKSRYEGSHTLRRSGARAVYEQLRDESHPYPIQTVQALLHHSTESQTRRYIGMETDRVHRNERIRGKLMYPSLAAPNVVSLNRHGGDAERVVESGQAAGS